MSVSARARRGIAPLLACVALVAAPVAAAERQMATMSIADDNIMWQVKGDYQKLMLAVTGGGVDLVREFATPYQPYLRIASKGEERLPDGVYRWELRVVPQVSLKSRRTLAAARGPMDRGERVELDGAGNEWSGPTTQSGSFAVVKGAFLAGGGIEPESKVKQTGEVQVEGNLEVRGAKSFVATDPADAGRRWVYAALEGPEAGTYLRGSARTIDGEATIVLPGHFARTTEPEGLTVQLTPSGEWSRLYVAERSPSRLVVRSAGGAAVEFDYLIQGVRKGFADFVVERPSHDPAADRDEEER